MSTLFFKLFIFIEVRLVIFIWRILYKPINAWNLNCISQNDVYYFSGIYIENDKTKCYHYFLDTDEFLNFYKKMKIFVQLG